MTTSNENRQLVDRFAEVASQFCSVVDSAPDLDRNDFVSKVYRILPKLIDEAIGLPDIESGGSRRPRRKSVRESVKNGNRLYKSLEEKLAEWDLYKQVFDPTRDTTEAILGSLADDIAGIYLDLKKGLALMEAHPRRPQEPIWEWRFGFFSHWGKHHAIDALLAIHFQLQNSAD